METMKSRLEDVHGHKETHKPKKIYHEEQKDHRGGEWRNKERIKRKTKLSPNDSEGEQLEQLCTMDAGEQKQNSAPTTEREKENHQQKNDNSKL